MKRIVLPTDFSDNAWNAINYALSLFEKEPCTFYVLHAYQVSPSGESYSKTDTKKKLEQIIHQIHTRVKNPLHGFETVLIVDSLLNAVGRIVIDKDVDYIFMGTKGSSEVKEIFMGSSTVSVIKNIDSCPIVAVPETYSFKHPKEMVFVTDFKHFYGKAEIKPLIDLAQLWGSMLTVTHIKRETELDEYQKRSKEMLKSKLKTVQHRFQDVVDLFSSVSYVINELAKQNTAAGIIAMLNRKHGFFAKLVREPVIKKVAFKTEVPFLVLPEVE